MIMNHACHTEIEREYWEAYHYADAAGEGEAIGDDGDTPRAACEREGWEIILVDHQGCVLAEDTAGRMHIVVDRSGPWAVMIAE